MREHRPLTCVLLCVPRSYATSASLPDLPPHVLERMRSNVGDFCVHACVLCLLVVVVFVRRSAYVLALWFVLCLHGTVGFSTTSAPPEAGSFIGTLGRAPFPFRTPMEHIHTHSACSTLTFFRHSLSLAPPQVACVAKMRHRREHLHTALSGAPFAPPSPAPGKREPDPIHVLMHSIPPEVTRTTCHRDACCCCEDWHRVTHAYWFEL